MRKPLNRVRLHKHLLKLLERPTTTLEYGPIREPIAAHVIYDPEYWPPYTVTLKVDANNGEPIRYVIHELLHVIFGPLVDSTVDETLEEVMIVALETYMYEYVMASKARVTKWQLLIDQKITSSSTLQEASTLNELVDRT